MFQKLITYFINLTRRASALRSLKRSAFAENWTKVGKLSDPPTASQYPYHNYTNVSYLTDFCTPALSMLVNLIFIIFADNCVSIIYILLVVLPVNVWCNSAMIFLNHHSRYLMYLFLEASKELFAVFSFNRIVIRFFSSAASSSSSSSGLKLTLRSGIRGIDFNTMINSIW